MARIAVRKLSRLGNELHMNSSMAGLRLTPGRFDQATVIILVLKRCVLDWVADGVVRCPETLTRASSINSMAVSLDRPYATIHRIVTQLIAQGWMVRTATGIAVANTPQVAGPIVGMLTLAHDTLVRLAEDFRDDVTFPAPARRPTPALRTITIQAALDVWLVPFEYARDPVAEWTSKLVWIVIVIANVRHITIDPELADRYAFDPTPDALRKPINVRAIARIAGLSYGTAFRHCRALAALDVISYDRDGWITVSRQLSNDEVDEGVHALLAYFNKRIVDLTQYGFDVADAASFYIDRRPPYVAMDI